MKKLLLILTLIASVFTSKGAVATGSNLAATNTAVITSGAVVMSLTVWSTNTSTTIVYLYDGYALATNSAWTNYTTVVTNQIYANVTTTGVTNNYTNTVIKTIANPHAAGSVVATPVVTLAVPGAPSSGTALLTFDEPFSVANRLTLSNSLAGLSYIVNYRSP